MTGTVKLSDQQYAIMQVLWDKGSASANVRKTTLPVIAIPDAAERCTETASSSRDFGGSEQGAVVNQLTSEHNIIHVFSVCT